MTKKRTFVGWFFGHDGEKVGPCSTGEIAQYFSLGLLTPAHQLFSAWYQDGRVRYHRCSLGTGPMAVSLDTRILLMYQDLLQRAKQVSCEIDHKVHEALQHYQTEPVPAPLLAVNEPKANQPGSAKQPLKPAIEP